MKLLNLLGKVRKILGKLTDFLIGGRERGLWEKGHGPDVKSVAKDEHR
jgi:hypothetical protein